MTFSRPLYIFFMRKLKRTAREYSIPLYFYEQIMHTASCANALKQLRTFLLVVLCLSPNSTLSPSLAAEAKSTCAGAQDVASSSSAFSSAYDTEAGNVLPRDKKYYLAACTVFRDEDRYALIHGCMHMAHRVCTQASNTRKHLNT